MKRVRGAGPSGSSPRRAGSSPPGGSGCHLADDPVPADGVADGDGLRGVQSHRLLQVDVLASRGRLHRLQAVPVRRGGDDDGVHVLLGQHLPVVPGGLDIRVLRLPGRGPRVLDVADGRQGGSRVRQALAEVVGAHAAGADEGEPDASAGWGRPPPAEDRSGHEERGGEAGGATEQGLPAGETGHYSSSWVGRGSRTFGVAAKVAQAAARRSSAGRPGRTRSR